MCFGAGFDAERFSLEEAQEESHAGVQFLALLEGERQHALDRIVGLARGVMADRFVPALHRGDRPRRDLVGAPRADRRDQKHQHGRRRAPSHETFLAGPAPIYPGRALTVSPRRLTRTSSRWNPSGSTPCGEYART